MPNPATPQEVAEAALAEKQYRAEFPDAIRVFDATQGQFRDVTQKDVDDLMLVGQTYGRIAQFFIAQHQQLGLTLKWPGFVPPGASTPSSDHKANEVAREEDAHG